MECNQQVVEALYVDRTVVQPGSVQWRPVEARDAASLPRSGAPNWTCLLLVVATRCSLHAGPKAHVDPSRRRGRWSLGHPPIGRATRTPGTLPEISSLLPRAGRGTGDDQWRGFKPDAVGQTRIAKRSTETFVPCDAGLASPATTITSSWTPAASPVIDRRTPAVVEGA